jgi:hypothetical protein
VQAAASRKERRAVVAQRAAKRRRNLQKVWFGSFADIPPSSTNVRFTPESGHRLRERLAVAELEAHFANRDGGSRWELAVTA